MLLVSLQAFAVLSLFFCPACALPQGSAATSATPASSSHLLKRGIPWLNQCTHPDWAFIASLCTRVEPSAAQAYSIICLHPTVPAFHQVHVIPGVCPEDFVCVDGPAPPEVPGTAYCLRHENKARLVGLGLRGSTLSESRNSTIHTGGTNASTSSGNNVVTSTGPSRTSESDSFSNPFILNEPTSRGCHSTPLVGPLHALEGLPASQAPPQIKDSLSSDNRPPPEASFALDPLPNSPIPPDSHPLISRSSHRLAKRAVRYLNECLASHAGWEFIFSYCLPQAGSRQPYVIYCKSPQSTLLLPDYALLTGECNAEEVCVQGPHASNLEEGGFLANTAYCLGFENIFALVEHGLNRFLEGGTTRAGHTTPQTATPQPSTTLPTPHALARRAHTWNVASSTGWVNSCNPSHPGWELLVSYCNPIPGSRSGYRKVCASLALAANGDVNVRHVTLESACANGRTCIDAPGPPPPPASRWSHLTPAYHRWGTARCLRWEDMVSLDIVQTDSARERRRIYRFSHGVAAMLENYTAAGSHEALPTTRAAVG